MRLGVMSIIYDMTVGRHSGRTIEQHVLGTNAEKQLSYTATDV